MFLDLLMLASSSGRSRVGMKYTKSFTKAFSLSFKYVFPKQLKKKKKSIYSFKMEVPPQMTLLTEKIKSFS